MVLWSNSGDSHAIEPEDLWANALPASMAARMPRSERVSERTEIVHVDGESFERALPWDAVHTEEDLRFAGAGTEYRKAGMTFSQLCRPPGCDDVQLRLKDMDQEGIWAEVVYPSIGLWNGMIKDRELYREGVKAANDWLKETFIDVTPRSIPAAEISVRSVDDAVAETIRVAEMGFKAISLPTLLDSDSPAWNQKEWEPLWATAEEAGMVIGVHIGSEAKDPAGPAFNRVFGGPGGAVLNYVETTYGGQRATTMLVTSGALDRHPNLKVLISEGGATWVPFIADRMDEGYRQHGVYVRPKLSRPPSEILYEQVYASFQHDKSAVYANTAMGYKNAMFGSDYPHMEGTYGHTQKTLHELFDDVDEATRYRMTIGAFLDLFPDAGEPPTDGEAAPAIA